MLIAIDLESKLMLSAVFFSTSLDNSLTRNENSQIKYDMAKKFYCLFLWILGYSKTVVFENNLQVGHIFWSENLLNVVLIILIL